MENKFHPLHEEDENEDMDRPELVDSDEEDPPMDQEVMESDEDTDDDDEQWWEALKTACAAPPAEIKEIMAANIEPERDVYVFGALGGAMAAALAALAVRHL